MDQLVRDKFETFAPAPPEHIWGGIQKGIAAHVAPTFFGLYKTRIIAAAVIVLLATLGLLWYFPAENWVEPDDFAKKTIPNQEFDNTQNQERTNTTQESKTGSGDADDSANNAMTIRKLNGSENQDRTNTTQGSTNGQVSLIKLQKLSLTRLTIRSFFQKLKTNQQLKKRKKAHQILMRKHQFTLTNRKIIHWTSQ